MLLFLVMCALRRLPLRSSHHPRKACITSPTATSLAIAVLVVYADQGAAEGEYFAKGDENRVMDLAQWWADEARHQHRASKDAQCHSGDELEVFHELGSYLPLITLIYTDVSRIRVDL